MSSLDSRSIASSTSRLKSSPPRPATVDEWRVDKAKERPHARELFSVDESKEKSLVEDADELRRRVAQSLRLATHARLDAMASVTLLASRAKAPTVEDRERLPQRLACLKGASRLALCVKADKSGDSSLSRCSDGSFNARSDAKSHGGAATAFKSYKIEAASKSVAESELSASSDAT